MNTRPSNLHPYWRSIVIMVIVALLSAALVACGGGEAPETESTVAVEAPPPVDESTGESSDEPSDEPAPDPTEPPAEQPTEPPTAAPTEPPAEEPTEAAESGTSTGQLLLTGDCSNAFYPVSEGRTLRYSTVVDGTGRSEYSLSFSDVSDSSFTVSTQIDGETIVSTTWTCTPEGLLSPEFNLGAGIAEGMTVEFVEASGQSIPTEDKFEPGQSWSARYVANVEMGDTGAGAMGFVQTIEINNESVAIEAVSVPAGDFPDAVRVESTMSISMAASVGGATQDGMGFDLSTTTWYAEGVGMVKQESSGLMGFGATTTELVAIEE